MLPEEILAGLYVKNNGNWTDIYNDIKDKTVPPELTGYDDIHFYSIIGGEDGKDYPELLRKISKPPFVIPIKEYKKDAFKTLLKALADPKMTIIGIGYHDEDLLKMLQKKYPVILMPVEPDKDDKRFSGATAIYYKDEIIASILNKEKDDNMYACLLANYGFVSDRFRKFKYTDAQALRENATYARINSAPGLENYQFFAVPGPSGSASNYAIKQGWAKLVDNVDDIKFYIDEACAE